MSLQELHLKVIGQKVIQNTRGFSTNKNTLHCCLIINFSLILNKLYYEFK